MWGRGGHRKRRTRRDASRVGAGTVYAREKARKGHWAVAVAATEGLMVVESRARAASAGRRTTTMDCWSTRWELRSKTGTLQTVLNS